MSETAKFKAIIRKIGNSNGITIPSDFVENKYLELGKEYWFYVYAEEKKEGDADGQGRKERA